MASGTRRSFPISVTIYTAALAFGLLASSSTALAQAHVDVLKAFDAAAQVPVAPLLQASDGNFYGTTSAGGDAGAGAIFRLTPSGEFTVLYTFSGGTDGAYPYAPLILGSDGSLYGTTFQGGESNAGTVFQLAPSGTLNVLYSFTGSTDGGYPYAGVIQDADGNLYGTTSQAGSLGAGTVYKLTPAGSFTLLYAFSGAADGGFRYAGLTQGTDGNLYGTTYQGGAFGAGTVFQLSPAAGFTSLYSFTGDLDGAYPYSGLTQGADGNFYGTASQGGEAGAGVVFQLTPSGTLTVLHPFAGGPNDGSYPLGSLVQGSDGNLYGTTLYGGSADGGSVFQLTPGAAASILNSFSGGDDGAYPYAGVILASDGNLYGTTAFGGASGGGTAYRVTIQPSLVTWNTPAPIVFGTRLSAAQLNATASVPGVFVYTPAAGALLHAGPHTLSVSFTPTDPAISPTTTTVTLTVLQAAPTVTWAQPAPIAYGTPLGNAQLRAHANISGTFVYDPPAGSVVSVGSQELSVVFYPANSNDYAIATASTTIEVTQATPVIAWNPAALAQGMAVGPAQLNANANTAGTFAYSIDPGTVLDVGSYALTAEFTPFDIADFTTASASATLTVSVPGSSGGGNEYPLQFTPAAGARGLVVAGYALQADSTYGAVVVGNCSYYTAHSGSGRGGGYKTVTTYYNQTCTWDLYGNLLRTTAGAPTVPPPIATNGTQTIYATAAGGIYTGSDSALPGRGFVYTPGSHYTWLTPDPYAVIQQAVTTLVVTLESDGDMPLGVSSVQASALAGQATVASTTCGEQLAIGSTCTVTVTYDPTHLRSATGLSYDTLTVHVNSDAAQSDDFEQRFTIVLTPGNSDEGD